MCASSPAAAHDGPPTRQSKWAGGEVEIRVHFYYCRVPKGNLCFLRTGNPVLHMDESTPLVWRLGSNGRIGIIPYSARITKGVKKTSE